MLIRNVRKPLVLQKVLSWWSISRVKLHKSIEEIHGVLTEVTSKCISVFYSPSSLSNEPFDTVEVFHCDGIRKFQVFIGKRSKISTLKGENHNVIDLIFLTHPKRTEHSGPGKSPHYLCTKLAGLSCLYLWSQLPHTSVPRAHRSTFVVQGSPNNPSGAR